MLHHAAATFQPSEPPSEFDPAAYVRDMRAIGMELRERSDDRGLTDFSLHPPVAGYPHDFAAVAARWHNLVGKKERHAVQAFLQRERMEAFAESLVGEDLQRGVIELERLRRDAQAAESYSMALHDEILARHENEGSDAQIGALNASFSYRSAYAVSDELFCRAAAVVDHMVRLPIRSPRDLAIKAALAVESRNDEEVAEPILEQIRAYSAPPELQAAE